MLNQPGIRANEVYSQERFMEILGIKRTALKTFKRKGLVVKVVGKFRFVHGNDFLSFIDAQERAAVSEPTASKVQE